VLQHKCHIILTTNILNKENGQKMCPLSFGSNVFNYFIQLKVCIPRANAFLTALYHQNLIRNTQIYNCFILKKKGVTQISIVFGSIMVMNLQATLVHNYMFHLRQIVGFTACHVFHFELMNVVCRRISLPIIISFL